MITTLCTSSYKNQAKRRSGRIQAGYSRDVEYKKIRYIFKCDWQSIYGVMSGKAAFLRVRRCRPKVLESADLSTRGARAGSREAFLYLGQTKKKQLFFKAGLQKLEVLTVCAFFSPRVFPSRRPPSCEIPLTLVASKLIRTGHSFSRACRPSGD